MSIYAMGLVDRARIGDATAKAILRIYADHADKKTFVARPGNDLLEFKLEVSIKTIQRRRRTLVKDGWLKPVGASRGGRVAAAYRLDMEKLEAEAAAGWKAFLEAREAARRSRDERPGDQLELALASTEEIDPDAVDGADSRLERPDDARAQSASRDRLRVVRGDPAGDGATIQSDSGDRLRGDSEALADGNLSLNASTGAFQSDSGVHRTFFDQKKEARERASGGDDRTVGEEALRRAGGAGEATQSASGDARALRERGARALREIAETLKASDASDSRRGGGRGTGGSCGGGEAAAISGAGEEAVAREGVDPGALRPAVKTRLMLRWTDERAEMWLRCWWSRLVAYRADDVVVIEVPDKLFAHRITETLGHAWISAQGWRLDASAAASSSARVVGGKR